MPVVDSSLTPFVLAAETPFQFTSILVALAWAVFGLFNFWIWKRSRSAGHLVMMVAAGWLIADALVHTLGGSLLGAESGAWATALGIALLTGGFYFTVQPLVAPDMAKLFGRKSFTASVAAAAPRFPPSTPRV